MATQEVPASINRFNEAGGFRGKTILITGATGFCGKVLVEKFLRTCPTVRRLYVIIRSKKNKSAQTRLSEMFAGPLYDLLRKTRGKGIFEKVVPIEGNVEELDLGLKQEDRKILAEEVQIIYHMAATIRFDDPFKKSVLLNTRGTKLMLGLAKECKNLLVFAHVSTAYAHPHLKVLHEKMYDPPADPHSIIQLIEVLEDEKVINKIANDLKGDYPNTYSFTKAMGEGLVNEQMDQLPVIIIRPSVVVPIYKDPLPGWSDNLHGPAGLLVGAGKGVIRSMYCKSDGFIDLLPVDIAANGLMLIVGDYHMFKLQRVYNLATSNFVKVTWDEIITLGKQIIVTKVPLNWAVWYPGGSLKSSKVVHWICVVLFHYIPAILVDSLLMLTGNKPVLWRVQQKVTNGFSLFEYYANNQWQIITNSAESRLKLMTEAEKEIYVMDPEGLDLEEYFTNAIYGARRYILNEPDDTIPTAKRHLKIMWFVDMIFKLLFFAGIAMLIVKYVMFPVLGIH